MRIREAVSADSGFTLVELVIIIIVLGILAVVAIPKYRDISKEARESSCRASLGALRSAISIWYANEAVMMVTPGWPPLDSLNAPGVVMKQAIPPNPFAADSAHVVRSGHGLSKGQIIGGWGGWIYDDSTGEVWPNTNVMGEKGW